MNKKIFVLAAILMVAGFFSLSAQNAENVESETAVEQQAPASTSSMKYIAAAVAVATVRIAVFGAASVVAGVTTVVGAFGGGWIAVRLLIVLCESAHRHDGHKEAQAEKQCKYLFLHYLFPPYWK